MQQINFVFDKACMLTQVLLFKQDFCSCKGECKPNDPLLSKQRNSISLDYDEPARVSRRKRRLTSTFETHDLLPRNERNFLIVEFEPLLLVRIGIKVWRAF